MRGFQSTVRIPLGSIRERSGNLAEPERMTVRAYKSDMQDDVVDPSRVVGTIEIPLELYAEFGCPESLDISILRDPTGKVGCVVILPGVLAAKKKGGRKS